MKKQPRFLSRKFLNTIISVPLFAVLPVVFKSYGVDLEVQLMALGLIGVSFGAYSLANVAEKKIGG